MTLLEFLDRMGERRANRPARPVRDIRQFIGFAFLAGYYWMVWQFANRAVPAANLDLIRDAMLTLGPPVGLIVGAMFRADARDDQATANTAEAFRTIRAAQEASATVTIEAKPENTGDNP
ncbi:hypothetical protein [Rhizorhabdus histidinilytica]|uniref:hypothetical protein n=1 Tax=Rhizorhabdus histidinilytica TaxID=439228 RepID=UPI00321F7214